MVVVSCVAVAAVVLVVVEGEEGGLGVLGEDLDEEEIRGRGRPPAPASTSSAPNCLSAGMSLRSGVIGRAGQQGGLVDYRRARSERPSAFASIIDVPLLPSSYEVSDRVFLWTK